MTDAVDELRTRYIDVLLGMLGREFSPDLCDRIERVLGMAAPEPDYRSIAMLATTNGPPGPERRYAPVVAPVFALDVPPHPAPTRPLITITDDEAPPATCPHRITLGRDDPDYQVGRCRCCRSNFTASASSDLCNTCGHTEARVESEPKRIAHPPDRCVNGNRYHNWAGGNRCLRIGCDASKVAAKLAGKVTEPPRLPPESPTSLRYAADRQLERQGVPKPPPGVAEMCPQPGCRGSLLPSTLPGERVCDECGKPPVLVRLSGE